MDRLGQESGREIEQVTPIMIYIEQFIMFCNRLDCFNFQASNAHMLRLFPKFLLTDNQWACVQLTISASPPLPCYVVRTTSPYL